MRHCRSTDVFLFQQGGKDTARFLPQGLRRQEINDHFKEYSYVTVSILPLNFMTRQGSEYLVYARRYLAWSKPQVIIEKVRGV